MYSHQTDEFVEEMRAWAEAQGDRPYRYGSHKDCAMAQFLKDRGEREVHVGGWSFGYLVDGWDTNFPMDVDIGDALSNGEENFAALAGRLEGVLMDRRVVAERELDGLENGR